MKVLEAFEAYNCENIQSIWKINYSFKLVNIFCKYFCKENLGSAWKALSDFATLRDRRNHSNRIYKSNEGLWRRIKNHRGSWTTNEHLQIFSLRQMPSFNCRWNFKDFLFSWKLQNLTRLMFEVLNVEMLCTAHIESPLVCYTLEFKIS